MFVIPAVTFDARVQGDRELRRSITPDLSLFLSLSFFQTERACGSKRHASQRVIVHTGSYTRHRRILEPPISAYGSRSLAVRRLRPRAIAPSRLGRGDATSLRGIASPGPRVSRLSAHPDGLTHLMEKTHRRLTGRVASRRRALATKT